MNVIICVMLMGGIIIASNLLEAAEKSEREDISEFGHMTRQVPNLADEIVHTIALELFETNPKISRKELIAYYRSPSEGYTYSLDILERAYKVLQDLKKHAIQKARDNFLQELKNAGTTEQVVIKHGTQGIPELETALDNYFRTLRHFGAKK